MAKPSPAVLLLDTRAFSQEPLRSHRAPPPPKKESEHPCVSSAVNYGQMCMGMLLPGVMFAACSADSQS